MSKKEIFINEIKEIIKDKTLSEDAQAYWETFCSVKEVVKPKFTENGKMILRFMQENHEKYNNIFKAAMIANEIGVGSKTVSGGMRKLVTDNYVEKIEASPICYVLTEKGMTVDVDAE